ncbi:MAG: HAMP domain-containing protein [Myxococcales bacterium]|nr:HAMP domain-containing protein [Myxococcales bacterium]
MRNPNALEPVSRARDSLSTPTQATLGLRAQIALALVVVLAIAAVLANAAIRPLTAATSRAVRKRAGVTLVRAVAGQIALLPADRSSLEPLVTDTVGEGALSAVAVLDADGRPIARAGNFVLALPRAPLVDSVDERSTTLRLVVALPRGGAVAAEVSLAQSSNERGLVAGVLLYTLVASSAALFVLYALLTRYTVRPLEALTRAAERVAAGNREARAEPRGAREISRAAVAFNVMTEDLSAREAELSARIHELERAQAELREAHAQLVRTERLAVVGRLAAGIAHEIGNPLAAIVGLADVMREGGLEDDEVQDFSKRIGREAERIHRTVRDLLDYARARPTSETVAEQPGDVFDAVDQVRRLLEPQKSVKDIALTVDVASSLPTVTLSNDRLVQVLLNLTLNAADAMKKPGEETAKGALSIRATVVDGRVRIDVEDDGPGIDESLRERVFEPFFTTKPAGAGTGLGLAICASLVDQAGGTLRALARPDGARGALLRVELPAASTGENATTDQ